jgi:leader peptidase (prepilin peptidase)/N-methyltransferase
MEIVSELPRWYLLAASFALGACVGSFLNVVIYRLPRGESLVWPGSHCPGCGGAIPFWANVPLVSYITLRARCVRCQSRIPARYPLVEALTALLFTALMLHWLDWGLAPRLFVDWGLVAALIAVTFIDAEHQIIPNAITYPGIVLGLVLAWVAPPPPYVPGALAGFVDALLALGIAGGAMWALSAGYERWRGHIGLGMGDVKLVAMLGTFLGLPNTLGILIVGSFLGLAYALSLMAFRGATRQTRIPFGPALALAGVIYVFVPGLLEPLMSGAWAGA